MGLVIAIIVGVVIIYNFVKNGPDPLVWSGGSDWGGQPWLAYIGIPLTLLVLVLLPVDRASRLGRFRNNALAAVVMLALPLILIDYHWL